MLRSHSIDSIDRIVFLVHVEYMYDLEVCCDSDIDDAVLSRAFQTGPGIQQHDNIALNVNV